MTIEDVRAQARLEAAAAEIELHVGTSGWDQRPALFGLVRVGDFARDEPQAAAALGLDTATTAPDAFTPIEQEALPDVDLDEALARVAWPAGVTGAAIVQEIVILPPSSQDQVAADDVSGAAAHPERREARLVVAVLRDGSSAAVLRLRGEAELLTGRDLAPNLAAALLATFD